SACRTTVNVQQLIGLFFLYPTLLGAMYRMYLPQLLVTGETDAAVLLLPSGMLPGVAGEVLGGVVMAGAFAAFLSTSSGLLVSVARVVSTDVLKGPVSHFRVAAGVVAVITTVLALALRPTDRSLSV